MPSALASGDQTVFWWKGNVTPPRSHDDWAALVRAVLRHLIDRYGLDEVRTWPIEVWNEPNLTVFWEGADQAAYHRLYEVTARAVKDVDASLQVGGPVLSPGSDEWWAPFADFVAARDVPIDFVSRHAYSSGPVQQVPFGVYQTFERPQALLDQFDAPRRHLEGTALAGLPVHISEFNTSYRPDNPVHDTAWNAAYLAPVLAGGGDLVDSFSYWTFCDVFEEADIPTSLFHGGFGLLTHRQVRKPTYHLYAFMARMGRSVLARGDDHLVCRDDDGRVTVLAWQPVGGSDDGRYGSAPATHEVRLRLPVTSDVAVVRRSVNETEGNAWTAWRELGRPEEPVRANPRPAARRLGPVVRHYALSAARRSRGPRPGARAARGHPGRARAGRARRAPRPGRPAAARPGRGGMTAMATKPDDEIGTGPLPRWSAVVYWFLVVEGMLLLTSAPGLVLLGLLDRDVSNVPLVALACVPFGPSVAAALFAWRVFARDRDLSPARHFWRGYRLDVLDVLRWWIPTLAVLAVVAVNLTHLGATGLPPALGIALGAVAVLVVLWAGHALVLSALFSFRTRDVARLGAYFVAGKPLVTLGFVSVLVLTGALAYASDWLLVLLAAPLTYLYARTAAPVVVAAEAQFTA